MAYFGNKPADQAIKIGADTILSSHIDDGVIVNADINASASIATSKVSGALTSVGSHGLATSATTDTTNASNIASGTLNKARLPADSDTITSVGTLTGLTVQGSNYTTASIQSGTTTHGAILNLGSSDDIDYGSITQYASGAGEGGRMRFIAGTTETMNLRGNKLGVGTNNPDGLIHAKVTTDSSETIRIQNDDSLTTVGVSSDGYSFHTYQHSLYWASWDGSTWSTKARLDSNGNLGLGTTSINSNAKLHIRGGDSGQTSSSNNTQLTVEGSGSGGIQILTGTTNVGGIWVGDSNGSETGGKLYYSNSTDTWSFYNSGSTNSLNISNTLSTFGTTVLIDGVSNYTGLEVKGSGGSRPQIKWSNVNNGVIGSIYGTESNGLVVTSGTSGTSAMTISSAQEVSFAVGVKFEANKGSTTAKLHWYHANTTGNYQYYHLKTDIGFGTAVQMYSLQFTGHSYNTGKAIDTRLVFYNYSPSSNVIEIGSTGNHTATVYESSDNKVVLRLDLTAGGAYYSAFTLSSFHTQQGCVDFSVTSVIHSNNTNDFA